MAITEADLLILAEKWEQGEKGGVRTMIEKRLPSDGSFDFYQGFLVALEMTVPIIDSPISEVIIKWMAGRAAQLALEKLDRGEEFPVAIEISEPEEG